MLYFFESEERRHLIIFRVSYTLHRIRVPQESTVNHLHQEMKDVFSAASLVEGLASVGSVCYQSVYEG